jgi:ligand-binding sensor domain-containing protein
MMKNRLHILLSLFLILINSCDKDYGTGVLSLLVSKSGDIFLGTNKGIMVSHDNGKIFQNTSTFHVTDLAEDSNGNIYATSFDGLFVSTENNKWSKINIADSLFFFAPGTKIGIHSKNKLIIGSPVGLFSVDIKNHILKKLPLNVGSFESIIIDINNNILAFGSINNMYCSQDYGRTWDTLSTDKFSYEDIVFIAQSDKNIYVNTFYSGLFLSEDFGKSWKNTSFEFPIFPRKVFFDNNGNIWCVESTGKLYFSKDHGSTWVEKYKGFENN